MHRQQQGRLAGTLLPGICPLMFVLRTSNAVALLTAYRSFGYHVTNFFAVCIPSVPEIDKRWACLPLLVTLKQQQPAGQLCTHFALQDPYCPDLQHTCCPCKSAGGDAGDQPPTISCQTAGQQPVRHARRAEGDD
jgi:hypothetical protein